MKQQQKLTISMAIFFLFVFVIFGVIIVTEKISPYMTPKIEKKLTAYLKESYPNITNDIKISKTTYNSNKYTMKVTSKQNNNLYFNINYSNKKITDTYEKEFIQGKTFLTHISNTIQKNIKEKTNKTYKITISTTLDNFSSQVKSNLLEEKNLESLRIYTLESNLNIKSWDSNTIAITITKFINDLTKNNVNPKNYTLIITDQSDITKSIKISNITTKIIENNDLILIIDDILNNKGNTNKTNITYEYLH